MGTRELWTCWQGTLRWNAELPRKYVGTETQFPAIPPISCAKRGSSANFCYEAAILVWQRTKSLYRHRYYYYYYSHYYYWLQWRYREDAVGHFSVSARHVSGGRETPPPRKSPTPPGNFLQAAISWTGHVISY